MDQITPTTTTPAAAPADYTHLLGTMVDALQDNTGRAYVSGMLIKTKLGGMHMLRRSDGTMFLTPADLQPATGEEKKRVITYHFKGQRRFPITTTEIAEILGRGFNEVKINGERITATSTVAEIAAAQGELYAASPRRVTVTEGHNTTPAPAPAPDQTIQEIMAEVSEGAGEL